MDSRFYPWPEVPDLTPADSSANPPSGETYCVILSPGADLRRADPDLPSTLVFEVRARAPGLAVTQAQTQACRYLTDRCWVSDLDLIPLAVFQGAHQVLDARLWLMEVLDRVYLPENLAFDF